MARREESRREERRGLETGETRIDQSRAEQ
jgi:hypothetical protein